MKIRIAGEELQRVIRACKTCIGAEYNRPVLALIELECKDGEGYATACDGFKMIQTRFAYSGDEGVMLIPPFGGLSKYVDYEIEYSGDTVSLDDGQTKIIRRIYDGDYLNWRGIAEKKIEPKYTIAVNPALLKKVLSVAGDCVLLEFYEELGGFFVRGKSAVGMVLPMRIAPGYDKMQRFGLADRGVRRETKNNGA